MGEIDILNFQSIVDLLNRREPITLSQLRDTFPDQSHLLIPGKMLGDINVTPYNDMLKTLAKTTILITKQEYIDVHKLVSNKLKMSSHLRFGSAVISSASSAGLVAALTQGFSNVALVAGILAFISSFFSLVAQYIEEYAGGKKSLQRLRDRLTIHAKSASEVEFEIQLMDACNNYVGLESTIRKLNTAIAEIRQIQLYIT